MYAPSLLLDMTPTDPDAPGPVVGPEVRYHVVASGRRVLRAVVTSVEFVLSGVGSFEFGCPLWITHKGKRYVNPGLIDMFEGAPVKVIRDGYFKVADGFMDAPQIDLVLGWATFKCRDGSEDVNRTNHGVGTGTGWSSITVDGGWGNANAVIGESTSPWGPAVTVKYGTDKRNLWHFAYQSFLVHGDEELKMSAIVNLTRGTSKARIITLSKRFLDKPRQYTLATAPIPTDATVGVWSQEFSLPAVQGEPGRIALVDVACWSPVTGTGSNQFSLRVQLGKRVSDIAVPDGGDSVDLVLACFRQAFAQAGFGGTASKHGTGLLFARGVSLDPADKSTFGSHIAQWSSTAEWRWDFENTDVQVGGTGDLGVVQNRLRVSNHVAGRIIATAMAGASKGSAQRMTLTARDGNRTFDYTYRIPDSDDKRGWDVIIDAPEGIDLPDFAQAQMEAVQNPARPVNVVLRPPRGARSSGDMLLKVYGGVRVGDRFPIELDSAGPFSQHGLTQRATKMKLEPQNGDTLTVQLEPIP